MDAKNWFTAVLAVPGAHRGRATMLAADAVGYSRLMQQDQEGTHARMTALRHDVTDPEVAAHGGVVLKNTGDGFLAIFATVPEGIRCAASLQRRWEAANDGEPPGRRISFRIGLNVADVILQDHDVYGDGVNTAARLQTYAEPGGIVVSDAIAAELDDALRGGLRDLGDLHLRNLGKATRAFALSGGALAADQAGDAVPGTESAASIVVLPFREQAAAPGDSYFGEGIVDDIIHGLSGLKELFVISRGSTLGYRDAAVDVRAIGRDLGVRDVLHGGIRRGGNRLRIRTELCQAEAGEIVYSDQHDGVLEDIFDLQEQIAAKVVRNIAPHVQERERLRAMRKHPQNMTSYDLLLQALGPLFRMDYQSFSLAQGLLQRAIVHDPTYAPAYSYAAYWHLLRVGQGWSADPGDDAAEAERKSAAAIRLDANDALALAINGHVHSYLKRDFATAVEMQDRAVDAGPSCAMAWTLSSVTRGFLGEGAEAVRRAARGLKLSPLGPHLAYHQHILSQAHYVNGDFDEAVLWGRRAFKEGERLTSNLRCLAAALVAIGEVEEARQVCGRLMAHDPRFHLAAFARQTPLPPALRDPFVARLRQAGVPD